MHIQMYIYIYICVHVYKHIYTYIHTYVYMNLLLILSSSISLSDTNCKSHPSRIPIRFLISRNNLKILCHPICNWLYVCYGCV